MGRSSSKAKQWTLVAGTAFAALGTAGCGPVLSTYLILNAQAELDGAKAAQAPVQLDALRGEVSIPEGAAYAQSKLALTMWTRTMALALGDGGALVVSVNPASLLGSKMGQDCLWHCRRGAECRS